MVLRHPVVVRPDLNSTNYPQSRFSMAISVTLEFSFALEDGKNRISGHSLMRSLGGTPEGDTPAAATLPTAMLRPVD